MRLNFKRLVVALVGLVLAATHPALAQDAQPESSSIVKKIEITGNKTTSNTVIISKLKTRVGEPFSQKTANEDLRRLYGLGFFSHISIDVDDFAGGVKVTFVVKEKPVLKEIIFKGGKHISQNKLKKESKLKAGVILDEKALKEAEVNIQKLYEKKGYQQAEVKTEVSMDEKSGQAIVYFRIDEKFKVKIKEINFTGNKTFTPRQLMKSFKTKPKGWFHFGILKEDVFQDDLERLSNFYKSKGYIDMKVVDVKKTQSKDGQWLFITVAVSEGKQYKVDKITVSGVQKFPAAEVQHLVKIKTGEIYTPDKMKRDLEAIRRFYSARGYIDARIRGKTDVAADPSKMNLDFEIEENELFHIDKIEISGNSRTKDKVIRRELNVRPGEVFNGVKVERSQERLQNLGYFKEVQLNVEPSDKPGNKNLVVNVEEQKTGELGFGAGFSSIDDFIGFVDITQNNFDIADFPYFTGAGQKLKLRAELGNKRRDFIASFTEPFLFDQRLAFGVDGFSKRREFLSKDYDEKRDGFDLRLGKPLGEFIRADVKYTLENAGINHVAKDAPPFIKSQEGDLLVSRMAFSLTRDTRNSVTLPSRGSRTSGTFEIAGLGGDADFTKTYASSSVFFPFFTTHILMLKAQGGVSGGFNKTETVPIFDRFFLGGANSIRGFKFRDVGPQQQGQPIGGEAFIAGTAEYTFPIISRIRGATFFDVGNVYFDRSDFDLGNLSGAVGVGLRVNLPIGPVQVDYGIPVITDEFTDGEHGRFSFNIGTTY